MIVVFVVDTSPSMGKRLGNGMSRLDLAKMAVESLTKGQTKRVQEHNHSLHILADPKVGSLLHNMDLGFAAQDQFLLLSTSRQHQVSTAACGAGGRLLVGFDRGDEQGEGKGDYRSSPVHVRFERELKGLKASPTDGGAVGLNAALSAGMGLMTRYRLKNRSTENFGLGRLPSCAVQSMTGSGNAMHALQPACLVLLTDGECLRGEHKKPLSISNKSNFYVEPFRWDQRIFCVGVGGDSTTTSQQYLGHDLKILCEVTGGGQTMLNNSTALLQLTESLLNAMAPPRPRELPVPDPLRLALPSDTTKLAIPPGVFINGGPVCCFQQLEAMGPNGEPAPVHRAMILYVPHEQQQPQSTLQSPLWCIPEAYFPSKKFDVLPARSAQPLLTFSRHYSQVGSSTFDPNFVIKALGRLDQLVLSNRKANPQTTKGGQEGIRLLHRDTYICEWISSNSKLGSSATIPSTLRGREYFPVLVRGAGRALADGEEQGLNIGILQVPQGNNKDSTTLTLLPPEPHILLPLLVKVAEAEHRALKKQEASKSSSGNRNVNVMVDEQWRSDFRAYMFRIPPYYHNTVKRCLRSILPSNMHGALLSLESIEALASQCFSKTCLQKIRTGEQFAKESNERMERQEAELRRRHQQQRQTEKLGYGQYDSTGSTSTYLAALKHLPAPWRAKKAAAKPDGDEMEDVASCVSNGLKDETEKTVVDILGDLPADCLMAYYESRRRWIFGGSGLATRGIFVDGVDNDGCNVQRVKANHNSEEESLLAAVGVGVSTLNNMCTTKMGDYRERLAYSRSPIVGYGFSESTGVAATTAPDGSPNRSVDDDAMPLSFFDPRTGEFVDSREARMRSRVTIQFGNPFKDRRGDSIIPDAYIKQCPPHRGDSEAGDGSGPSTPPGSPPHDPFATVEGEGEALFAEQSARSSPPHTSPPHTSLLSIEESRKREADEGMSSQPKREKVETPAAEAIKLAEQQAKRAPTPPKPRGSAPPPPRPPARKPPPPPPSQRKPPPAAPSAAPRSAKPDQRPKPPAPAVQEKKAPPPAPSTAQQSPDQKPNVNLPPGWMSVWSKSQKRWYFFDTKTNKSVWQWPPPGGVPS